MCTKCEIRKALPESPWYYVGVVLLGAFLVLCVALSYR